MKTDIFANHWLKDECDDDSEVLPPLSTPEKPANLSAHALRQDNLSVND
jgi:hypothetical protein